MEQRGHAPVRHPAHLYNFDDQRGDDLGGDRRDHLCLQRQCRRADRIDPGLSAGRDRIEHRRFDLNQHLDLDQLIGRPANVVIVHEQSQDGSKTFERGSKPGLYYHPDEDVYEDRRPVLVVEGESEIVAGHMVEYSGMSFAMFFLAEYANMILISMMATLMFLGGWSAPLALLDFIPGWIWLGIKTFMVVTLFLWVRSTFPRYRYDQIMRLGWKIFIPVTLVWLVVVGLWMQTPYNIWK